MGSTWRSIIMEVLKRCSNLIEFKASAFFTSQYSTDGERIACNTCGDGFVQIPDMRFTHHPLACNML